MIGTTLTRFPGAEAEQEENKRDLESEKRPTEKSGDEREQLVRDNIFTNVVNYAGDLERFLSCKFRVRNKLDCSYKPFGVFWSGWKSAKRT